MTERVRLTLDGRHVEADADASLLAALWNHGARAVRTSVSGAMRGPLCAMGTCFECRVTVDGEPHVRACLTPVREGMTVALDAQAPSGGARLPGHAPAL
jgi:predicted molibdopterin-dependent oxidoreductase YjgC